MRLRFAVYVMVWLYLALAMLYALNTPRWQVPDEPAHYNYIRTIAEQAAFPVLQFGDYDQQYLDTIKARHFPADMSIDAIRYESHQPPLYYLLAAPLYKMAEHATTDSRLIGLRFFSSLLGTLLLALVFRIAYEIFPTEPFITVFATAFAAFVPQHLAMMGGVDNDALAEVVLAGIALGLLRILAAAHTNQPVTALPSEAAVPETNLDRRRWLVLGILMGIGFITKSTTYVSVGLLLVTFVLLRHETRHVISLPRRVFESGMLSLLIGSLWFARDAATYGATDILGLARHNAVVADQPQTLQLFPSYLAALPDFMQTLFRSFWGQFGWMGVILDSRIYVLLFAFSVFALLGLVPFFVQARLTRAQIRQLFLLLAWIAFVLLSTIAYSLDFYQAQGRYLFPALGAIAIMVAMGIRGWLSLGQTLIGGATALGRSLPWAALLAFVFAAVVLDLVCLYRFIVPQLVVR